MNVNGCGWCGSSLAHLRSNAVYCSKQHKKNAASKRHRERNPGYYKRYTDSAARVAWREANRDQIRSYAREQQARYRQQNPDAGRAWWQANPERHRLYRAKRRAAQQTSACLVTERDIRRLLHRYRNACAYCQATDRPLHLDHVVPLKRGGRHSIGNLVPACQPCNSSKNARLLSSWRITVLLTNYAHTLEATG